MLDWWAAMGLPQVPSDLTIEVAAEESGLRFRFSLPRGAKAAERFAQRPPWLPFGCLDSPRLQFLWHESLQSSC